MCIFVYLVDSLETGIYICAENNFRRMAALVNHVKTLYEAKLYEDVKTLVSMVAWTELLQSGSRIDVFSQTYKVPHHRLVSKLYSYQVNEEIILWIESFLRGRKQTVKIDEVMSQCSDVLVASPSAQYLGLSCLLFILMI